MPNRAGHNRLVELLALSRVPYVNPVDVKKLIDYFGSAQAVFNSSEDEIRKVLGQNSRRNISAIARAIITSDLFDEAENDIKKAGELGASVIAYNDPDYPHALKYIPDPPSLIFVAGNLLKEDTISISIVGTRLPTSYGKNVSNTIAGELAKRGVTVVSGMAKGIDSEAHRGAIEAGGRTIAVMGTGIDITFPPENRKLRAQIEKNGAVITEYPPGTPGMKAYFPARNRIICGLSLGTVIIEAPEKSGALITARYAIDYNRELFAVPADITSSKSAGSNKLITEGIKAVTKVEDILEEFDINFIKPKIISKPDITKEENTVLESLGEKGAILENIIDSTGFPPHIVSCALVQLELKDMIRKMPGNLYIKKL